MSRWASKIPGVAHSQRAYITFLNKLRADSFDAMANSLGRRGKITIEEAQAISNFINVATGRGEMGTAKGAVFLNTIFFAPRLAVSRFQMLAGQPLYRGNARARSLIAQEYARFLAGASVVYSLGSFAGAKIETDPRSSDFLKMRFGETRLDPLGGLIQATVFMSRMASGKTKLTGSGKLKPARTLDTIGNFLRNKAAPVPGAIADARDILTGQKPPAGHPQTLREIARGFVLPMSADDLLAALQEQGVPKGVALGILSLFGMGLQTHEREAAKKAIPTVPTR
jgi:hypothetical protein